MPKALAAALMALALSTAAISQERPDFLDWSERDAERIIDRGKEDARPSFGSIFGGALRGALTTGRAESQLITAIWVTDRALQATARLNQLNERRSDEWAIEYYEELHSLLEQGHAFVVHVTDVTTTNLGNYWTRDGDEDNSESQIFLQQRNDEDKFVRTRLFEQELPDNFNPAQRYEKLGEFGLVMFDKTMDDGEPLIQSLDDELELVIPTEDSGDLKMRFKVKDLVESLDEL